jgi:hypothetical protein
VFISTPAAISSFTISTEPLEHAHFIGVPPLYETAVIYVITTANQSGHSVDNFASPFPTFPGLVASAPAASNIFTICSSPFEHAFTSAVFSSYVGAERT